MKLILVNQRYGHTRTIVIRGWMKGLLSLCLMGAPVALGYLGYELAFADAGSSSVVSQESGVTADEFTLHDHPVTIAGAGAGVEERVPAEPASDLSFEIRATLASAISLLVIPHFNALSVRSPGRPASFRHGRIVDPASYLHRTLH